MIDLHSADRRDQLPLDLRWCVGKFVYVRGAHKPLHFMELKNFIIDDATDYSHLFYLRGLRFQDSADGPVDDELKRWMEGTAVKPIAEVVAHLIGALGISQASLVEYFPGVGLAGEYVKLILQQQRAASGLRTVVVYEGRGPAALKNQFLVLQAEDSVDVRYSDDLQLPPAAADLVTIVNFNHSVKYDAPPPMSLEEITGASQGPLVVALRATAADRGIVHTTVKGRRIELPSVADIRSQLRAAGSHWRFRFIEKFDAGFFLPAAGAPTGLLLAYDARRDLPLDGFEKV